MTGPSPPAATPGSAGRRTSLAWQRSGLSLAAAGAIVAKGLPGEAVAQRPVLGSVVAGSGFLVWLVAAASERRRRRAPQRPVATLGVLAPLALATTAIGLVLMVVVAWPN